MENWHKLQRALSGSICSCLQYEVAISGQHRSRVVSVGCYSSGVFWPTSQVFCPRVTMLFCFIHLSANFYYRWVEMYSGRHGKMKITNDQNSKLQFFAHLKTCSHFNVTAFFQTHIFLNVFSCIRGLILIALQNTGEQLLLMSPVCMALRNLEVLTCPKCGVNSLLPKMFCCPG